MTPTPQRNPAFIARLLTCLVFGHIYVTHPQILFKNKYTRLTKPSSSDPDATTRTTPLTPVFLGVLLSARVFYNTAVAALSIEWNEQIRRRNGKRLEDGSPLREHKIVQIPIDFL